jgi:hypothetical protein
MAFNFSASASSSLTVTDFKGVGAGLAPGSFSFSACAHDASLAAWEYSASPGNNLISSGAK